MQITVTPMYAKAADDLGVLRQSAAKDEFEFLDGNTEWIQLSVSGDSRGCLLRSSMEVPEIRFSERRIAGATLAV